MVAFNDPSKANVNLQISKAAPPILIDLARIILAELLDRAEASPEWKPGKTMKGTFVSETTTYTVRLMFLEDGYHAFIGLPGEVVPEGDGPSPNEETGEV